jgi:hypothetical protein
MGARRIVIACDSLSTPAIHPALIGRAPSIDENRARGAAGFAGAYLQGACGHILRTIAGQRVGAADIHRLRADELTVDPAKNEGGEASVREIPCRRNSPSGRLAA